MLPIMQEETLQLPKGRKQPHSAADHFFEGGKDCTAAATFGTSEKDY